MTFFTSYAQNCEDVLLWRALGHLPTGFYIDVGANDTEEHSVTKAFYERGWSGINIEPLPIYHQRFAEQRPRDINLPIAAGSETAEITLYDVEGVHGWASLDPAVAQQHRDEGYTIIESTVPVLRLTDICAQHVTGPIHFLKIDVEGFEEQVLRGMDFRQWRPWLLLIEATLPNSQITNHQQWEYLVLEHDYQFAYFDGLNRYYVAAEHAELAQHLHLQPNVFDNFHTVHLVRAWEEREALRAEVETQVQQYKELEYARWQVQQELQQIHAVKNETLQNLKTAKKQLLDLELHLSELQTWSLDLQNQVTTMQASISWRITRPIRKIAAKKQQWFGEQAVLPHLFHSIKQGSKEFFSRNLRNFIDHPRMREILLPRLAKIPFLHNFLQKHVRQFKQSHRLVEAAQRQADVPPHLRPLPLEARKIFAELQRAQAQLASPTPTLPTLPINNSDQADHAPHH